MLRRLLVSTAVGALAIMLVAACSQSDGSCCEHCRGNGPSKSNPSPPSSVVEAVYDCPMHPEMKHASPGKCPKCGMELERQQ